jgi:hypothetical protein
MDKKFINVSEAVPIPIFRYISERIPTSPMGLIRQNKSLGLLLEDQNQILSIF